MMPILTAAQIREADAYTIAHEPIRSIDLMERAATVCFNFIIRNYDHSKRFIVFCGTGNNGGDGLAIARLLLESKCDCLVYIVRHTDKSSNDFSENEKLLKRLFPEAVIEIKADNEIPSINDNDLIIDCIFGTGLSKPPDGLNAAVIKHINASAAEVIAIDMPSGLYADATSVQHKDVIINATHTLTFQVMKLAFMFPENAKHCGSIHLMDIKLDRKFIASLPVVNIISGRDDVNEIIKPRKSFSHKGNYGHALIMAGSYGKAGAAQLAAKACLRSGAGLVTVNAPMCAYNPLQAALPEAMLLADENQYHLSHAVDFSSYQAIGVGPGIGLHTDTQTVLKVLIQNSSKPIVMDADAINILAENKTWLSFLPPDCILTPHVREFERLAGKSVNDFDRHQIQVEFSVKYQCYVVLKGKYTCITTPKGRSFFNPTGNAGMATAGAGDVLTGIITALLAQGHHPAEAAIAGVYLHGLAGDLALHKQSMQSLIAGDIIESLGDAFSELSNTDTLYSN